MRSRARRVLEGIRSIRRRRSEVNFPDFESGVYDSVVIADAVKKRKLVGSDLYVGTVVDNGEFGELEDGYITVGTPSQGKRGESLFNIPVGSVEGK